MNQEAWTYLAQLTRALQQEGVDGRRAGEFVAEIDSHLAETGADPVDKFGTPFELAVELARRPGSRRPGWVPPTWTIWAVGLFVLLVFVVVFDAVTLGWDDAGVPIRARGAVYLAVFYPALMVFGYAGGRRLSGRSWAALTRGRSLIAFLGFAIVANALSTMAGDRVITLIPVPLFWGVAAVVIPLLVFSYSWWPSGSIRSASRTMPDIYGGSNVAFSRVSPCRVAPVSDGIAWREKTANSCTPHTVNRAITPSTPLIPLIPSDSTRMLELSGAAPTPRARCRSDLLLGATGSEEWLPTVVLRSPITEELMRNPVRRMGFRWHARRDSDPQPSDP